PESVQTVIAKEHIFLLSCEILQLTDDVDTCHDYIRLYPDSLYVFSVIGPAAQRKLADLRNRLLSAVTDTNKDTIAREILRLSHDRCNGLALQTPESRMYANTRRRSHDQWACLQRRS